MHFKIRALKRYNGSPLGLNQFAESGLPRSHFLQRNAGERQERIFHMSDSSFSESTRASAVGVPMMHIEKVRLHTICVCLSVC